MTASEGRPRRYALDANALTALWEGREVAGNRVRQLLLQANRQQQPLLLSAVNWGEVFYVTWRRHGEPKAREIEFNLRRLPIEVVPADRERATRAAALKQKHNLGYADSFAAELAMEGGAWLVTADPEFSKLGKALSVHPLPRHER